MVLLKIHLEYAGILLRMKMKLSIRQKPAKRSNSRSNSIDSQVYGEQQDNIITATYICIYMIWQQSNSICSYVYFI